MKGKERCKILKEIRQKIATENEIPFVTSECRHKGDCLGTCPKCESELRYLERELERRTRLGKSIAVAGIATTITLASTSCSLIYQAETLDGDMAVDPKIDGTKEIVTTMGDLLVDDGIEGDILPGTDEHTPGILPPPDEDTELMGEPVEYARFIPEEIEGYDSFDEDFISECLVDKNISEVTDLWGDPDLKQAAGENTVYVYFSEIQDISITYNSEGIITAVSVNENI